MRALHRAGWIEPTERTQVGGRPERQLYAPTDTGRAALVEWVDELVRTPADEYPAFVSAVTYLGALRPRRAAEALRTRAGRLRALIAELRAAHEQAMAQLTAEGKPRLYVLEAEYARHMAEAELAWVELTITEIDTGSLEWPAPPVNQEGANEE